MPTDAASLVHLRAPHEDDEEEFVSAMRKSKSLHRPWLVAPTTTAAFERFVERSRRDDHVSYLVRVRARSGEGERDGLAGVFNITNIIRGYFHSAYLSYWATAAFAGKGFMSAGFALVLREAFLRNKLHRLEANIQPGNAPSIALVLRAGFAREGYSPRYLKINGRWRDHERWALLVEDWRARRSRSASRSRIL
jgi:ribosomal-protein-alanine N-acetyltransferase